MVLCYLELLVKEAILKELRRGGQLFYIYNEIATIENKKRDRFGKLDIYTKNFLDLIIIKILASKKGVERVSNYEQNISFIYENDKKNVIKSRSKDEDDILNAVLTYLR